MVIYNHLFVIVYAVWALLLGGAAPAHALEPVKKRKFALLEERVHLDFIPAQAFFLVDFNQSSSERHEGIIVPPYGFHEKQSLPASWYFGVRVPMAPGQNSLFYSLVIAGAEHGLVIVPAKQWSVGDGRESGAAIDERRETLEQKKSALKSLDLQFTEMQDSVKRLHSDAEIIGNLGRIVEKRDETDKLLRQLSDMDKVIATLNTFVSLAKGKVEPARFLTRETMLKKQLPELSEAAKRVEAEEITRKLESTRERNQSFSLIESTRYDDYNAMVSEFEKLKHKREVLEQKLGIVEVPPEKVRIDQYPQ